MPSFAELLDEHMARAGLNATELSRRINVHRHTLMRWRKGDSVRPDCDKVYACIEHLELTPAQAALFIRQAGCHVPDQVVSATEQEELSPFVVGQPIFDPRQFCGFKQPVERIFKFWRRMPLQNIAVIGARGSGKTSLLHYLQHNLRQRLGDYYRLVMVDFKQMRMRRMSTLLQHLLQGLNLPPISDCSLIQFEELISHAQLQNPTLILLDDIEFGLDAEELDRTFWWGLRAIQQNYSQGKFAFLMTSCRLPLELAEEKGKPSPFFNVFGYQLTLEPFSEAEIRTLIARSPLPFPVADIDWIIRRSGGHPSLVQSLCMLRLCTLEDGDGGDSWRRQFHKDISN